MAKHKRRAEAAVSEKDTAKKKNQAVKKSKTPPKTRGIKDKVTRAKTIAKAVKPRGQASKNARKPSDGKKSKYFSEPLKEEPEDIFEDSSMSLPESSVLKSNDSNIKEEKKENDNTSEESDEDEDWEEVEELAGPLGPAEEADQEPAVPSQPVEIEIETAEARLKRQKKENKQAEFETYLRRAMKRFTKEIQMDTHKVHLLCLLASGLFRNRLCCEPDLLAITLSLVPTHFTTVYKKRINTVYLEDLLKWFKETFTLNPALPEEKDVRLQELLERRLGSLSARDHQEMTYLFLLVLRSLRLYCRLVLSLQPISLKPTTKTGKAQTSRSPPSKDKSNKADKKPPEPKISPGSKRPSSSAEGQPKKGGKRQKRNVEDREVKKKEVDGQRPKNTRRRSTASKVSYKEESSDGDEELSDEEEFQLTSEDDSDDSVDVKRSKGKEKGKSQASRRSSKTKKRTRKAEEEEKDDDEEEEDDDDEEEDELVCKKQWRKKRQGKGNDEWIEVYLKEAKRWICIGVDRGVDHPKLCSNQATQPITYVVGIDDNGYLKDVSSRYDPTWLTSSRKRRIDSEWWKETLGFFECPDSKQKQKEDKELQETLMNKPLPTSISEYKNHPLYALERHMLKYEALYPTTATILGYCRGEAVYSRDCVHTLHSRDIWLKQARTVRLGEEPYKMVKGSSNRSRKARLMSENKENKDLPLFGHWQTEEYQPPVAINGKIPRNEFGNVYMFQPCMLPVGCVHLHLPNLNRVARKLNLDCASAVTGFDFHGGYSHAVIDGYIVCEEHEEILKAAWENEQEIQKQKEKEKREKRALANWTLLVKGLLIKQRLQRRYGQQGVAKDTGITQKREGEADGFSSGEEGEGGAHMAAPSLATSWPQNRQEDQDEGGAKKSVSKRERRGQQKHLFPFEKSV